MQITKRTISADDWPDETMYPPYRIDHSVTASLYEKYERVELELNADPEEKTKEKRIFPENTFNKKQLIKNNNQQNNYKLMKGKNNRDRI